MIRFDILHMPTQPSLKSVLLAAAGCSSLLATGGLLGCASEVKVQRVVYDTPTPVASTQTTTEPDFQFRPESGFFSDTQPNFLLTSVNDDPAPLTTIEQVRQTLEAIYDIDAKLVASSMQNDPNRAHSSEEIAKIDRQHAESLMTIIERFGWPTREMVGLKAVQGAYIAIQHAGHDPDFQSNCLALIQQQVDQGELPGAFLALMTDRVSISRGEPQVFGTQMTMAPDEFGVMHAVPSTDIWEADSLDQRRAALRMPPHQRFIDAIELAYFDSVNNAVSRISSVPTE
tara:strand:- start:9153 stop:10010 length:858 start_codon:yes stop_codon:yes gene_type:complete